MGNLKIQSDETFTKHSDEIQFLDNQLNLSKAQLLETKNKYKEMIIAQVLKSKYYRRYFNFCHIFFIYHNKPFCTTKLIELTTKFNRQYFRDFQLELVSLNILKAEQKKSRGQYGFSYVISMRDREFFEDIYKTYIERKIEQNKENKNG